MIYLPLGDTSLFNMSYLIDILPGPVSKRLMDIAVNSELVNIAACLSSAPTPKPSDNQTTRVAPIISIIKMAAVILVILLQEEIFHL
jgi:hypothetical protein